MPQPTAFKMVKPGDIDWSCHYLKTGRLSQHGWLLRSVAMQIDDHLTEQCVLWPHKLGSHGYGQITISKGVVHTAPHLAFAYSRGLPPNLPDHECVRHTCDVTACVNIFHLLGGTYSQNNLDCVDRGRNPEKRKTHCPENHPYAGLNLITTKRGSRACRTCTLASSRRSRSRKKALAAARQTQAAALLEAASR